MDRVGQSNRLERPYFDCPLTLWQEDKRWFADSLCTLISSLGLFHSGHNIHSDDLPKLSVEENQKAIQSQGPFSIQPLAGSPNLLPHLYTQGKIVLESLVITAVMVVSLTGYTFWAARAKTLAFWGLLFFLFLLPF